MHGPAGRKRQKGGRAAAAFVYICGIVPQRFNIFVYICRYDIKGQNLTYIIGFVILCNGCNKFVIKQKDSVKNNISF